MALKLPDRWIWDSWYVKDGDTYHAFYLCASRGLVDPNRRHRNPYVGHAVSKDLVNWTDWEGENLIQSSEPYDELYAHKSWVLKYKGIVYHFYCAVNKAGDRGSLP